MYQREKLVSIVVPLHNEEGNVKQLHGEIVKVIKENNFNVEIIFVEDGSSDNTYQVAKKLSPLKIIRFRKNFGQTAAMDAGIKEAKGEIIITMDGDLQNDPADIPGLLQKIGKYDVVSGWRKKRKDSHSKRILSRGADILRRFLVDDGIRDSGCTLKAYRAECFNEVDLYGEIHRFIPAVLKIQGFRIGEIEVNHRARNWGVTKYNWRRIVKGILDMLSIWFWRKFSSRPLHLFGGIGIATGMIGLLILFWMAFERIIFGIPLSDRIWPMMGIFSVMIGFQLIISGLLADILIKTYHHSKKEKPYKIKEIIENK